MRQLRQNWPKLARTMYKHYNALGNPEWGLYTEYSLSFKYNICQSLVDQVFKTLINSSTPSFVMIYSAEIKTFKARVLTAC